VHHKCCGVSLCSEVLGASTHKVVQPVSDSFSLTLTSHKFCASTGLQSRLPYCNCLQSRWRSTQHLFSQFKQQTQTAIDRPIQFLKHNRNKAKHSASAAKLSEQTSLSAVCDKQFAMSQAVTHTIAVIYSKSNTQLKRTTAIQLQLFRRLTNCNCALILQKNNAYEPHDVGSTAHTFCL